MPKLFMKTLKQLPNLFFGEGPFAQTLRETLQVEIRLDEIGKRDRAKICIIHA